MGIPCSAKVPEDLWPEVTEWAKVANQAPSRKIARGLAEELVQDYEGGLFPGRL